MRSLILTAASLALAAGAAAAQPTTGSAPGSAPIPPTAVPDHPLTGAPKADPLAPGRPVKDKNGVVIGQIDNVKPDAGGNTIATIRMGADSFAVNTSAIATDSGTATVNATADQIRAMLAQRK